MGLYKINKFIISMNPIYPYLQTSSEKYKIDCKLCQTEKLENIFNIKCDNEYYIKNQINYKNLSLNDIENIITCAQFSSIVMNNNAIILHASAILFKNKIYLFCADSGVGKSTHTKLWQEYYGKDNVIIVNDDKPLVTIENDLLIASGTPWSGNSLENVNLSAPVSGIVFIERDTHNELIKLNKTNEILPLLFNNSPHLSNKDDIDKLLTIMGNIVSKTNFYKIKCNISVDAVKEASKIIIE